MDTRRCWTGLALLLVTACGDGDGGDRTTALPEGACTLTAACGDGQYCDFADGSCGVAPEGDAEPVGTCESHCRNSGCTCVQILSPVCGCDGQTYSSSCEADVAGVSIAHEGACPCGSGPPCPGGMVCCNPVAGICALPDQSCALGDGGG